MILKNEESQLIEAIRVKNYFSDINVYIVSIRLFNRKPQFEFHSLNYGANYIAHNSFLQLLVY